MKAKVKYSEETRMEEMDEAMMEARAMNMMHGSFDMPKMKFGRKKGC
jgi:hypothetical protein